MTRSPMIFIDSLADFTLYPCTRCVYIVVIRGPGVGQHVAVGQVAVIILAVSCLDPAGTHIAYAVEAIPLVIDLEPAISRVGAICEAVPPAYAVLDPGCLLAGELAVLPELEELVTLL